MPGLLKHPGDPNSLLGGLVMNIDNGNPPVPLLSFTDDPDSGMYRNDAKWQFVVKGQVVPDDVVCSNGHHAAWRKTCPECAGTTRTPIPFSEVW